MEITEVRIKLMEDSDDRLQAFCSITFDDCFVVRDLKIIEGANGPFVAMPSRKLTSHCGQCGSKNHLRSLYCNQCGSRQQDYRAPRDSEGRTKLYADIAHPINSACREMIQDRVISEFEGEQERAKQPGYVSRYDEDYDLDAEFPEEPERTTKTQIQPAATEPRPPHRPPQPTGRPKRSQPKTRRSSAEPTSDGPSDRGASESGPSESGPPDRGPSDSGPPDDGFGAGIFS